MSDAPLGLMTSGERLELARYRLKHSIPVKDFRSYHSKYWELNKTTYHSQLTFRMIYEITQRNQTLPLEDIAKDIAGQGGSQEYASYLDAYSIKGSRWRNSFKIELSSAAQKILTLVRSEDL